jgi:hypothetical protein
VKSNKIVWAIQGPVEDPMIHFTLPFAPDPIVDPLTGSGQIFVIGYRFENVDLSDVDFTTYRYNAFTSRVEQGIRSVTF